MRVYSNPERENHPYTLPDVEVFYVTEEEAKEYNNDNAGEEVYAGEGWYWWSCFPGCLPDSDAFGPFDSEAEAIENAQDLW
jgi:hypothetical protein